MLTSFVYGHRRSQDYSSCTDQYPQTFVIDNLYYIIMLVLHSGNHEDEVHHGHEQLGDDDLAGGGGQAGQVGHQAQP